jgi:hypothetical protein
LTSSEGQQVSACVPTTMGCGDQTQDAGTSPASDAGSPATNPDAAASGSCGALAPPDQSAGCHSCSAGGSNCQPNGCYGGWYCNTTTDRCQSPPPGSACTGVDAGPAPIDAGPPQEADAGPLPMSPDGGIPSGSFGPGGGTLDALTFAIVGDTRPGGINDTAGYPVPIITRIWQDVQNENPRPAFAVTTGDYMFASSSGNEARPQLQMYLTARQAFQNLLFPAMGNHECTGATAGNCAGSTTNNLDAFISMLLAPIGQTRPYYSINIAASDGSWTAKLVFVAANAWDSNQGTWLDSVLSQPTTYTFVIRHERSSVTQAPGVSPSEQIIRNHPLTMRIVGHTHTYQYAGGNEVVIGNGGAPITGGVNYGYVIASRRSDGAIVFTAKDYQTTQPFATFAVHADGTPAP